jgi:nicotinate-nucleotide--dimethylbenzimidazole phosphoribosyltransferase
MLPIKTILHPTDFSLFSARAFQLACALAAGRHAAERAKLNGAQLFIGGEMGIANTSAATALASALLDIDPVLLAGPGTGLDANGVSH